MGKGLLVSMLVGLLMYALTEIKKEIDNWKE